jgi:hypothetical protein
MDSFSDYKRTRLPYATPYQISKSSQEVLLNNHGSIRAVIENGVVVIQTKKLKGDQRELARINTNVSPVTIELLIEGAEGT